MNGHSPPAPQAKHVPRSLRTEPSISAPLPVGSGPSRPMARVNGFFAPVWKSNPRQPLAPTEPFTSAAAIASATPSGRLAKNDGNSLAVAGWIAPLLLGLMAPFISAHGIRIFTRSTQMESTDGSSPRVVPLSPRPPLDETAQFTSDRMIISFTL